MRAERDYTNDLAEIRSMMERSSRFLSLEGKAGILAGIYALAGAFLVNRVLGIDPGSFTSLGSGNGVSITGFVISGLVILLLAAGTAVFLSYRKSLKRKEALWNAVAKRMLISMAVPLVAGGILLWIFLITGLPGLVLPMSMIFYGIALYNASQFTFKEIGYLGLLQLALGLLAIILIEWSLVLWAVGFGLLHLIYGLIMHFKYER